MKLLAVFLCLLASPTAAGELTPRDYSPTETASIRTIAIKRDPGFNVVVVGIANRSAMPFDANYACTLMDAAGRAFGTTGGSANTVPPSQEVVSESISFPEEAAGAACRIEFTTPTN
jgi:hypothetical protein